MKALLTATALLISAHAIHGAPVSAHRGMCQSECRAAQRREDIADYVGGSLLALGIGFLLLKTVTTPPGSQSKARDDRDES